MSARQRLVLRRQHEKAGAPRNIISFDRRGRAGSLKTKDAVRRQPVSPSPFAVARGTLVGLSATEGPLVDFEGNDSGAAVRAETTVELQAAQVGGQVTLVFFDGDPSKPVVTGVLRSPAGLGHRRNRVTLSLDGERLVLSAGRELVLRCGKSSITMHSDGTIEVRGTNLLSASSGTNRIRGGAVSLN